MSTVPRQMNIRSHLLKTHAFFIRAFFKLSVLSLLILCSNTLAASAATWRLYLTNIDDKMDVYVNNNLMGSCTAGSTCNFDLTSWMATGANTIGLQLTNNGLGFAYNYALVRDDLIFAQDACGQLGVTGCSNNDQTPGAVRSWAFLVIK